jgi:hypothetical protein
MYKFIYSNEELHTFYDRVLPPLTDTEVYFISLSARKKYMKGSDRDMLDGSSEMFERRLIEARDWTLFYRTLKRYECEDGAYQSLSGISYPNDAMIVYMNFNPVDTIKAYEEFIMDSTKNMMSLALGRGSDPMYFKRVHHNLMTAMHHSRGTKHYIDLDVDYVSGTKYTVIGRSILAEITDALVDRNIKFYVISTHGGYHILVKTSTIHFDYMKLMKEIQNKYPEQLSDIMNNANGMVPLPGTLQAGHQVSVLYDISNY